MHNAEYVLGQDDRIEGIKIIWIRRLIYRPTLLILEDVNVLEICWVILAENNSRCLVVLTEGPLKCVLWNVLLAVFLVETYLLMSLEYLFSSNFLCETLVLYRSVSMTGAIEKRKPDFTGQSDWSGDEWKSERSWERVGWKKGFERRWRNRRE